MAYERTDRRPEEFRNLKMTTGFISSADGSVLIEMGRTRVICNATLLPKVPDWLAGRGTGWITAEYSLLPLTARVASLSITNSRSSLKLMSIELVMLSSHLILSSPSPPAPNPSQHQSLFQ